MMEVTLYSYCMAFKIDPNIAKHTPLEFMMNMLLIHSEVEAEKARQIEKQTKS